MTCDNARQIILELEAPDAELSMHLAGCAECRSFLAMQQSLDEQLARSFKAPDLSPQFRSRVMQRVSQERSTRRSEAATALTAPCAAVATSGLCALAAPELAPSLFAAGLALGILSYLGQILYIWITEELGEG